MKISGYGLTDQKEMNPARTCKYKIIFIRVCVREYVGACVCGGGEFVKSAKWGTSCE